MVENQKWYKVEDAENIISPSLLVYPNRIEENLKTMIKIAGGTNILRPHIKTHKIAEIIELQLKYGINKFKCATIAEAELLGSCGVEDILLAMQPVGVHIRRFFNLMSTFPNSKFSTIVDSEKVILEIAEIAEIKNTHVHLWLDINNGMNRTGILPNNEAIQLYKKIDNHSHLIARGLHVYDGHIHISDYTSREKACDKAFNDVLELKKEIEKLGIKIKRIVAGGTPTFPIHVKRENIEVSPGTTLLWDHGYSDRYKDLKFLPAAVLLSRIVSKPNKKLICLDLGHKSVAAEMSFPRVKVLNIKNYEEVSQSEEHIVLSCNDFGKHEVGDLCYAIPTHICPTVIKYNKVLIVRDKKIKGHWKIGARDYSKN